MAEISSREGRSAFRRLIVDGVPPNLQTRANQLLDAIVFSAEPILRGLEYFELKEGTSAPSSGLYPSDGYGLYIDTSAGDLYGCLQWQGTFYTFGGGGLPTIDYAYVSGNDPATDITGAELEELSDGSTTTLHNHSSVGEANTASNLGAGVGVYETKVGVDLQFNSLVSANAYLIISEDDPNDEIDFEIDLTALNPALDHGLLTGLGDDDHTQYLLADGTRELTGEWGLGDTYGISEIHYLDFTIAYAGAHQEARVHWNDDDGCLNIGMKGGNVELQTGLEQLVQCRNVSGAQIDNGTAVKIVGATGNKPQIEKTTTTNPWDGYSCIGLATEDIGNNSNGYVTTTGLVRDVDTSSWSEGDALYLSNVTPGALTNVYPTPPEVATHVGVVVRQHATDGEILVSIATVPPLTLLADTFGTPSADGDFYTWDQTTDTRFELDNINNYLPRAEWLQNGFQDAANETSLLWDDSTRTLTLDNSGGGSFGYYYEGILYTETGSLTATITDTEGLWAFYIGSGGAASLSTIHNPSEAQIESAILNETIVAYVYWDATNNDGRLMDERHGSIMSRETHHYLHETRGAVYYNGMALGDITTDQSGAADSDAQFSITAGRFYDEDLQHNTLARASTDTWEAYYVDGSGDVRWVDCEATFPVYAIGGVIAYNNAGTLTAVPTNKYCLYHVFATNIHTDAGADYYPVVTPGTAVYNTKAGAQDAASTEIAGVDFGDWPQEEVIPVATVIYYHGAAMTNGVEAAIQSTLGGGDYVDWRFTQLTGSTTSVNDHGALSGLADDDHTQYLLADGTRALSAAWDTGLYGITTPTVLVDELSFDQGAGSPGIYAFTAPATSNLVASIGDVDVHWFGDQYIDATLSPSLRIREAGSASSYSWFRDSGTGLTIGKTENGAASIGLYPYSSTGDDVYVNVFNANIGGGDGFFRIFDGTASPVLEHELAADGTVTLCQTGENGTFKGNLYIDKTSSPTILLREGASATDYSSLRDEATIFYINKEAASGANAVVSINPKPADNTSVADVRVFRYTNTSGSCALEIFKGDNTASIQHAFYAAGDADLCQQGGQLTLGGTGGASLLTLIGGDILLDNTYGVSIKDSGGTVREVLDVTAGNVTRIGANNLSTQIRSDDEVVIATASAVPSDAELANDSLSFWYDSTGPSIKVKHKDSGGTVRNGTVCTIS